MNTNSYDELLAMSLKELLHMDNTLDKSSNKSSSSSYKMKSKRYAGSKDSKAVNRKPLGEIKINQLSGFASWSRTNQPQKHLANKKVPGRHLATSNSFSQNVQDEDDDVFISNDTVIQNNWLEPNKTRLSCHRNKILISRRKARRATSSPFPSSSRTSLCHSVLKMQHGKKCNERLGQELQNTDVSMVFAPTLKQVKQPQRNLAC